MGDIVLNEGLNQLNVQLVPVAPPALAGSLSSVLIWYEGLAGWESLVSGREIPTDEKIYLSPGWWNESGVSIVGHIDLLVTYPDGSEVPLTATANQDKEAAPGNGWSVQFAPFLSSQEGTYTFTATLYSAGQVLDSITFTLIGVFVAPPAPDVVVSFPELAVWDVEGVPFTEVGEETLYNWDAFGECLQASFSGGWFGGWIADGVGLARCMEAMGAVWIRYTSGGVQLFQCGLAHPEYITSYAKSGIGKVTTVYDLVSEFRTTHGFDPYIGYTWEAAYTTNRVTGFTSAHGEDFVIITWTQKVINWYLFNHQAACDTCGGKLAPFTGLVATLAEPIEMDSLRGVSLTWLNQTLPITAGCGMFWHLWFEPAFDAPMPPPAYRNLAGRIPPQGQTETVAISDLFGSGYYYPGVYDGIIQWEAGCNYFDGTWASVMGGGRFKIKNLVRVTGEGVI